MFIIYSKGKLFSTRANRSEKRFAIPKQLLIYATQSKNLSTSCSYPEGLLSNIFKFTTHIMQQVNWEQCWKLNKPD
jgi:hypothetical protein